MSSKDRLSFLDFFGNLLYVLDFTFGSNKKSIIAVDNYGNQLTAFNSNATEPIPEGIIFSLVPPGRTMPSICKVDL